MTNIAEWVPYIIGNAIGAVAVYVAIRVDLAVLKVRAEHNEKAAQAAHDLAGDAHDRINRLRKSFEESR